MLYLLFDIWYRYLPCYAYYLISDTGTCHAILITWYLILVLVILYLLLDIWYQYLPCYTIACYLTPDIITLDMLSPGTGTLDLISWHLYYIAYSWLLLLWGLGMIIILLPDIWYSELMYSWTPVLLNSCISEPLKKGDSWYFTPVDPRNRITMNIGLL